MVYEEHKKGILLRVRLQPNSSCCKVSGIYTDSTETEFLKINVISVPEKGKANKELITFLAEILGVAKSDMEIISGELDRYKKIVVKNKDISYFREKLKGLI